MILHTTLLTTLVLIVEVLSNCAEQLQRCAVLTEEYERIIQEIKHSAFRNCFIKRACAYEWTLFEDCFGQSVRAVRVSLNRETPKSDNFGDSAHRYLVAMENCFDTNQRLPHFTNPTSILLDDDAIYARTIYGIEYVDRLWGLPQLMPVHPYLNQLATEACLVKDKGGRVFGNGISRYIDSGDPELNNLNNSCILDEKEMQCYYQRLTNDKFYQDLLVDRDRIIRSCMRRVRLQSQCHASDRSFLRACLCSAREEFENRVQASILQCVRRSYIDQLYHRNQRQQENQEHGAVPIPIPVQSNPSPPKLPYILPSFVAVAEGTVWNGRCLCVCPHKHFVVSTIPNHQIHTDSTDGQIIGDSSHTGYSNIR